jgi:hypothetical protein
MNLKYQEMVFDWILYLSWILYLTAYFGILYSYNGQAELLKILDTYMKYYISAFLLIRFNPFTKTQFTNFDRKVVFSSAIFLITTTALGQSAKKIDIIEHSLKFMKDIS